MRSHASQGKACYHGNPKHCFQSVHACSFLCMNLQSLLITSEKQNNTFKNAGSNDRWTGLHNIFDGTVQWIGGNNF